MGFFSANCDGCGHPLLCAAATNQVNNWMNRGVAIMPGGSILKGSYDGYGRFDQGRHDAWGSSFIEGVIGDATVWHDACWHAAGAPQEYRGPSAWADDQGWFFAEGAHDLAEPSHSG